MQFLCFVFFFFFQAEDGIRDTSVTGVQTCALPILIRGRMTNRAFAPAEIPRAHVEMILEAARHAPSGANAQRSEERRVGKEGRSRGSPHHSEKRETRYNATEKRQRQHANTRPMVTR